MVLNPEWCHRIDHWRNTLPRLFYRELQSLALEGFITTEQLRAEEAEKRRFSPMPPGTAWGNKWDYAWLRTRAKLPKEAAGERIVFCVDLWKAEGNHEKEAAIYVNGVNTGARDKFHRHLTLTPKAKGNEAYSILIEAYAGHGPFECGGGPCPHGQEMVPEPTPPLAKVGSCSLGIWDEEVYQLWLDMETLFQTREVMADKESLRVARIDDALQELTLVVDLELPRAEMLRTIRAGRKLLKPLLEAKNGSSSPLMHCFGHSHIDVAWLWPLRETGSKCARTFGTQLSLMKEYPEYKFLQSQCHLYWMVKNKYPALYKRIQAAVKQGQWLPEGGMWVEADTNITGGESLIRQFLHGKQFYKEEFGIDSELMWLPDVFGYSAVLPQIMKGCGIKYFSTQKIFWTYNGGDPFPYNSFWWEGLDGSKVLAYIHNDYNSVTTPTAIMKRWTERVQKEGSHPGRLLPFGHGDGGGGATRDHLEYLRRLRDCEGIPRCTIDTPTAFFEKMQTDKLPTWVGELYFQAHRGTYTSQAKTKKGNRLCEFALRETELWGAAARALAGSTYPHAETRDLWRTVLLNQFHDIIPGSSIHRVYEEAEADYARVLTSSQDLTATACKSLLTSDPDAVTLFNSLSWERDALVTLPRGFEGAESAAGEALPVQQEDDTVYALVKSLPACGWTSLRKSAPAMARTGLKVSKSRLENEYLKITLNALGEITGIWDKEAGRELAAGPCNQFRLYKDVPNLFDAWDIDSNYKLMPVELEKQVRVEVGARGPLFASLKVSRQVNMSRLTQEIVLRSGSRRVEFRTRIDWQESHKLLKVNFPITIRAEESLQEVQFGHVKRPTHATRPYDATRFEVANHKWTALCEEARGAAILNDCKYGVSIEGNSINLTLLKSALAPDMTADKGLQEFTYAFICWNGAFKDSGVVQEGYDLNVPPTAVPGRAETTSLFRVSARNVILETVKPAEDGSGDIIVRLYESIRSTTRCRLSIALPVKKAHITDMLEKIQADLPLTGGDVELDFGPFEIKTLRLKI